MTEVTVNFSEQQFDAQTDQNVEHPDLRKSDGSDDHFEVYDEEAGKQDQVKKKKKSKKKKTKETAQAKKPN